jgi:hypothetical protein
MKSQLIIPKKIKVGFNLRSDTYTGKLGYVIYHDGKTWRKEKSWEGWRQKEGVTVNTSHYDGDKWIQESKVAGSDVIPLEFENVPTEGFVLNKKAGGGSSGWNHRNTYCRVFDPRGFEFEVSIPNLLFILQEASSFKGKGLEGEFVYSWEGKDLVLLPVCCNEYKQSEAFTQLQTNKIGVKNLTPGCSYKTKKQEDLIYLGKFSWYSLGYTKDYENREVKEAKYHIFAREDDGYEILSSLTSLALKNNDIPVSNYAELMDVFSKNKCASKPVKIEDCAKTVDFGNSQSSSFHLPGHYFLKSEKNVYDRYYITSEYKYEPYTSYHNERKSVFQGYVLTKYETLEFKDNLNIRLLKNNYNYNSYGNTDSRKRYSKEEIEAMDFKELFVVLDNGNKIEFEKY